MNWIRKYYRIGMISLIMLPIISVYYFKHFVKQERCIELSVPSKYEPHKNSNECCIRFDTTILSQPEYRRRFIDIEIGGDASKNKQAFKCFEEILLDIVQREDVEIGLHIVFNDYSTYGDFINAINICRKDTFARFMVYENHIGYLYKQMPRQLKNSILKSRAEKIYDSDSSNQGYPQFLYVEDFLEASFLWPIAMFYLFLVICSFTDFRLFEILEKWFGFKR